MLNCGDVFVYSDQLFICIGYTKVNEQWCLFSYTDDIDKFLSNIHMRLNMYCIQTGISVYDKDRAKNLHKVLKSSVPEIGYILCCNNFKKLKFKNCSSYVIKNALVSDSLSAILSDSIDGSEVENFVRKMYDDIQAVQIAKRPSKELQNNCMYAEKVGNLIKFYYREHNNTYALTDFLYPESYKIVAYSKQLDIELETCDKKPVKTRVGHLYKVIMRT